MITTDRRTSVLIFWQYKTNAYDDVPLKFGFSFTGLWIKNDPEILIYKFPQANKMQLLADIALGSQVTNPRSRN